MPNAGANRTGFNIIIVHFYFLIKCLKRCLKKFLVWVRTSSNLADINLFQSPTEETLAVKHRRR